MKRAGSRSGVCGRSDRGRVLGCGGSHLAGREWDVLRTRPSARIGRYPAESLAVRIAPDSKVLPPEAGIYTGMFTPPAPFEHAQARRLRREDQQAADGRHVVSALDRRRLRPVQDEGSRSAAQARDDPAHQLGAVGPEPEIPHTRATAPSQPKYRLQAIVDGKYDAYIRSWARAAAAVDGPIMLRPMHEMNGTGIRGPARSTATRRRSSSRRGDTSTTSSSRRDATNVTWVWSVNAVSCPTRMRTASPRTTPATSMWTGPRSVASTGGYGYPNFPTGRSFDQHVHQTADVPGSRQEADHHI